MFRGFFLSDYAGTLLEEMHYRVTLAYGLRICAGTAENHWNTNLIRRVFLNTRRIKKEDALPIITSSWLALYREIVAFSLELYGTYKYTIVGKMQFLEMLW